jgi:hypothetical protein
MSPELPRVSENHQVVKPRSRSRRWSLLVAAAVTGVALLPLTGPVAQSATKKTTTVVKKKKATTTVKKKKTTTTVKGKKTSTTSGKKSSTSVKEPTTDAPSSTKKGSEDSSSTSTTLSSGSVGSTSSSKPPTSPPVGANGLVTWFIPGTGKVLDLGAADVAKLAGGARVAIDVRGQQGLAASGTGSVVLDITANTPTQSGRVTLTPVASQFAQAVVTSQAQFVSGATTINRIAVPIGDDAQIRVETQPGPQGLTISVVGWVVTSKPGIVEARGYAMQPCRVVDTEKGIGLNGPVTPQRSFDVPAAGVGKIPLPSAAQPPSMVLVSVTLKDATAPTGINVVPTGQQTPALSLLAVAGNSPSGVFAIPVGADPRVSFFVTSGSANMIVELIGYTDKDGNGFSGGPC